MNITEHSPRPVAQGGPPLPLVAGIFTALFLSGLAASAFLGGTLPSPFAATGDIQQYFATEPDAVLAGAVLQFAAAVPLAVFAATAHARLRHLGVPTAAATIALAGGLLASAFATLSALFQWTLSRPTTTEAAAAHALHDLAFLTGGPAHVVALGLLIAGIAIPALITGLLPRWLAATGLALAVTAAASTLMLIAPAFAVLLPLARFGGMAWLIAAAARLQADRSTVAS